jgi:hypothetical protein
MMPDRDKTRPYLLEQVHQAEIDVKAAELVSGSLGPKNGPRNLNAALARLAMAGAVLALADAEWGREAQAQRVPGKGPE